MIHELKTWPTYFQDVLDGLKRFELRKYDRNYREGDILHLREWNPAEEKYTGNEVFVKVEYILPEADKIGLPSDMIIMGIRSLPRWPQ